MTVSELIAELQKQPQGDPVRVLMECVEGDNADGYFYYEPIESEALEVTEVRWRGVDVMLFGGGMAYGKPI